MKNGMTGALLAAAILTTLCGATAEASPGDMSRHPVCASFARNAVHWNNTAKGIGCRLAKPFTFKEAEYYKWCMNTDDASFRVRSPKALGHKKNLENFCEKQSGATIQLE